MKFIRYLTICFIFPFVFSCKPESDAIKENSTEPFANDTESESAEDYLNEDFAIVLQKLDDPNREYWQNPELVVDKLGDLSGKVVADIGVGTGYFTFKIASKAKHVIAIDVEIKFLDYIEERKFELGRAAIVQKIETRLSELNDPLLKPTEADVALIVDTYHFIENRIVYLKKVNDGLTKNGLLMIVDYKAGKMQVGPPEEMKISIERALHEIEEAGFSLEEVDTTSLQYQYIIKATK